MVCLSEARSWLVYTLINLMTEQKVDFDLNDPLTKAAILYSRVPRYETSVEHIALNLISEKDKEPCDVYLYQTEDPDIRKFGISKNADKRGKNTSKNEKARYKELLSKHRFQHRWQAICIEWAICREGALTKKPSNHVHIYSNLIGNSTELTDMNAEEFDEIVVILASHLNAVGAMQFLTTYEPDMFKKAEENIKRLKKGEIIFAIDCRWDKEPRLCQLGKNFNGMDEWLEGSYRPIELSDVVDILEKKKKLTYKWPRHSIYAKEPFIVCAQSKNLQSSSRRKSKFIPRDEPFKPEKMYRLF